jgi:hypothetical protein
MDVFPSLQASFEVNTTLPQMLLAVGTAGVLLSVVFVAMLPTRKNIPRVDIHVRLQKLLDRPTRGSLVVAVASKAKVKVDAVRMCFECVGVRNVIVIGVDGVASGINEQPFGDEETAKGALNRLVHAKKLASEQTELEVDMVVAFEVCLLPTSCILFF